MDSRIISLNKVLKKYNVVLAYLFGSQKDSGIKYLHEQKIEIEDISDLDICILLETPPLHLYKFYGNLYYDLSAVFKPFNVDIVFLHEINYLFKYEITKGHRIYTLDQNFGDEYEENIMKFASDLSFKRRMFEKDFYEALENGHFEIKL